jgi:uncharacterized membrane protein HdeD (DUF308 family)
MLRNILLALGGTLIAAGLVALIGGSFAPSVVAMVWGAILVFGILYERYVYKTIVDKPPAGKNWVKTTERFVNDKTGKTVTVYYNTLTGERAYVAE